MATLVYALFSVGGILFLVFLVYFLMYYLSLDEFISTVKSEYPLEWAEFENKTVALNASQSQIGYGFLRAVIDGKISVDGNAEIIAKKSWRYQNIGGVCVDLHAELSQFS